MKLDFESSYNAENNGCNNNIPLSVAVLVGGKSSRMGKDKTKLLYEGKSFLNRIITELSCLNLQRRGGRRGWGCTGIFCGRSAKKKIHCLASENQNRIFMFCLFVCFISGDNKT